LESLLNRLTADASASASEIDEMRINACKILGDVARDDQHKAIKKFLCNRKLASQLACCARSSNEALQFEALRTWWNMSFNDQGTQALAMEHLGVTLLTSLLESPNASLRQRAVGLIWNLTQHDDNSRRVFTERGVVQKLGAALHKEVREIISSASPPWGMAQLVSGALANIAMTSSGAMRSNTELLEAGQALVGMDSVAPEDVQQQATRMICNIISEGNVDKEWQANRYCYRSSAPKEIVAV